MEEFEQKVQLIYNDCWKNYKDYLSDHDMTGYNKRSEQLIQKYNGDYLIRGMLVWFAPIVQTIHDGRKTNAKQEKNA